MSTVSVLNMEGNEVGTMELSDAVFGAKINEHLVHMAVVQQLANNRQGDRKEPDMQDRVLSGLRNGKAAVLYLHRHQGIILSKSIRKKRGQP